MHAFTLDACDTPPALRDLPTSAPAPGDGELLVRVDASSINPVDNAIAAGMLNGMVDHEFPVILGRDYACTVEEAGPGTTRFKAGDDVFGFLVHADPTVHRGAWAERITVAEAAVAARPADVPVEAAGATPLAGITALSALELLELAAGETVLVVGATGGVGSFAVQLAASAGAHVIATGWAEDEEYLRGLGAAEVVDRDGDVGAVVRAAHPEGIDALVDLVSYTPDAFGVAAAALKPEGRASSPLPGVGEGERRFGVMAKPEPAALDRLARQLSDGTLRVPIQARYGLAEAGDGLAALATTHTRGKLAVSVP